MKTERGGHRPGTEGVKEHALSFCLQGTGAQLMLAYVEVGTYWRDPGASHRI